MKPLLGRAFEFERTMERLGVRIARVLVAFRGEKGIPPRFPEAGGFDDPPVGVRFGKKPVAREPTVARPRSESGAPFVSTRGGRFEGRENGAGPQGVSEAPELA